MNRLFKIILYLISFILGIYLLAIVFAIVIAFYLDFIA